jgi:LuxR family maltose regulon positive regulatory protein
MVMPAVELFRARLWVATNQVKNTIQWAQDNDLSLAGEVSNSRLDEYMVLARLLIAQDHLEEAADLLARMLDMAEKAEWMGTVIEILVLRALALQAQGRSDSALSSLDRALISAEPEGYVRTFVDEGEPMASLLREAETRGIAPDYVPKLLAAFETDTVQVEQRSITLLIEPLSERELEVLRLLNTELSGPEIASELTIALSTVRTYTKSIYSKLNVNNRRAAVIRAEELNLI